MVFLFVFSFLVKDTAFEWRNQPTHIPIHHHNIYTHIPPTTLSKFRPTNMIIFFYPFFSYPIFFINLPVPERCSPTYGYLWPPVTFWIIIIFLQFSSWLKLFFPSFLNARATIINFYFFFSIIFYLFSYIHIASHTYIHHDTFLLFFSIAFPGPPTPIFSIQSKKRVVF